MWLSRSGVVFFSSTVAKTVRSTATMQVCSAKTFQDDGSKTPDAAERHDAVSAQPERKATDIGEDLFESLPLGKVAAYLGETFAPKLEEIQTAQRLSAKPKNYAEVFEPPHVPHFLPLTRWAAKSEQVRETLVVDETRKQRPRLSWYHPEDTMVPRGWFSKGLWEDIKYYRPFASKKETNDSA